MSKRGQKKRWRLEVTFRGETRTVAYKTEAAARRSERFEQSCGAESTRVYRREDEEEYR